jgi:hypothetical protein
MGTHQSLDLVAKLLSDPGDSVLIETPCHWGAPVVFLAAGLAAQPIAIDSDGACLPELQLRVRETGIEPFSLLLKIKGNFQFEKFSTSMCTLSLRAASVLSVATGFHRENRHGKFGCGHPHGRVVR